MENTESQGSELMTQNELTQLGDFDEEGLSPLPPQSPMNLSKIPWGRLIPCSKHWSAQDLQQRGGIDLLPKQVSGRMTTSEPGGISFLGLDNIKPSDVFNEYTLGRSKKCDVTADKPPQDDNGKDALQEWAHAMISNRHCRIFCMLTPDQTDMDVFIEDTSGNGTLINNTTLLRRGEKRILHTGDEVCLVNPTTLQKKIRSKEMLHDLQRHHSFIFINVFQQQGQSQHSILAPLRQRQSGSMRPPFSLKPKRGLVDVRAMNNHSLGRSSDAQTTSLPKQDSPRRKSIRRVEQEYDIRDVLGSGTCGEVRRAIHRQTGEQRAVKIIPLGGRNRVNAFQEASAAFEAEASILQALDHPYIVKLVDVFVSPGHAVYLVMELLHGGDCFDRIVQKGKYTEDESRRVMRRLLNAIFYLHEIKNVVHRDLKPENILLVNREDDIHVKLTDFGLAKSVTEDGLKTFCGTPQYFAPEVLRRRHTIAGRGRYGKEADMWSLGVILYILLSGTPPFDVSQGLDCVVDAKIEFPADSWLGVSEDAKDLVRKLLMADPQKRISVTDACKHRWILTNDGDTHTFPLDDPAVGKVLENGSETLLSSRSLFSSQKDFVVKANKRGSSPSAEHEAQVTCETSIVSSQEAEELKPAVTESSQEKAAAGETASSEAMVAEPPVSPMSQGTIQVSNAAKYVVAAPIQATVRQALQAASTDTPLQQSAVSDTRESRLPMIAFSTSDANAATKLERNDNNPAHDKLAPTETNNEAPVAVPLSLNARSNNFRALVVKNIDADVQNAAGTHQTNASRKISPEDKRGIRGILVTPKSSDVVKVVPNRLSTEQASLPVPNIESDAMNPPPKKRSKRKVKVDSVESRAAELSDDEICSQFSDDGDSVCSFGASAECEYPEKPGHDKSQDEEAADEMSAGDSQTQKRKKRRIVFGLVGRSAAANKQQDGFEVSDEDVLGRTSAQSNPSGAKTKSKGSKKGKSLKESKSDATGGRQTTLSSWFKNTTKDAEAEQH